MKDDWISRFSPTPNMIKVNSDGMDIAAKMCEEAFKNGLAAFDALVQLPHENEDSSRVKHGANMKMVRLMETFMAVGTSFSWILDRDTYDSIRYKYRFVCSKYVTPEEFDRDFAHIKEYMKGK